METLPDATDLKERAVIITGAGNGLGLAIAQRFVAGGAKALLVDRDETVLQRVGSDELPATVAVALVKDLADDGAANDVFEYAQKLLGQPNALINNAAWSFHKPMLDVTEAEFDRLIRINQRAPFFLAQEFCRTVTNTRERPADPVIVNIASVNAFRGNSNLVAYAGTKGALTAMTRAMAVEMAPQGIRVNSISPGAVDTSVTRSLVDAGVVDPAKLFEKLLNKRFASCAEIAELVVYLCSSRASYVNGANWIIDGGYLAG